MSLKEASTSDFDTENEREFSDDILPSYELHTRSIGQSLNLSPVPPDYDDSSCNESRKESDSLSLSRQHTSTTSNHNDADIVVGNNSLMLEPRVIDNMNFLQVAADSAFFNYINLDIHLIDKDNTEEYPSDLDSREVEYEPGDEIKGFLLVKNTSDEPLYFKLFYIIFEGIFMVKSAGQVKPKKIQKFIDMVDLVGSYQDCSSDKNISQLTSPYCRDYYDEHDQTYSIIKGRKLVPKRTVKRFFSFKIPTRVLDIACSEDVTTHLKLPPTIGDKNVNDFSFVNTSIDYGVLARFIGHSSNESVNRDSASITDSNLNGFSILKEAKQSIRLVPNTERSYQSLQSSFIDEIDNKIKLGEHIRDMNLNDSPDLRNIVTSLEDKLNQNKDTKLNQLYSLGKDLKSSHRSNNYYMDFLLKEKKMFKPKMFPAVITTSKINYTINYKALSNQLQKSLPETIDIPITITFTNEPIAIRNVSMSFMVVTMKSEDNPIPIELNHDLIFDNKNIDSRDDYNKVLLKEICRTKLSKLNSLSQDIDIEAINIRKDLVDHLQTLANIEVKHNNFKVNNIEIVQNNQAINHCSDLRLSNSLCLTLRPNIYDLSMRVPDRNNIEPWSLVPSFQHCHLLRIYYLDVYIHFANDQLVRFKIPVSIVK